MRIYMYEMTLLRNSANPIIAGKLRFIINAINAALYDLTINITESFNEFNALD